MDIVLLLLFQMTKITLKATGPELLLFMCIFAQAGEQNCLLMSF